MTIQRLSGGKQTDWQSICAQTDQPIITIITSTYNVAKDLHWTIDSIKVQSYLHIQWIVADGASNDGTVEILQEHNELIDYWFSEPDTGIYDAWNKALEHVQGDWVQFIGAGDELYEPDTLTKVARYLKDAHPEYDLVYGQVMHISEKGRKELFISGEPWDNYKNKWEMGRPKLPAHPAIYHHVSIFSAYQFQTSFKIVADSYLLMQCLDKHLLYIDLIVDKMPVGGVSDTPVGGIKSYKELLIATKMLNIPVPFIIRQRAQFHYLMKSSLLNIIGENKYKEIADIVKPLVGRPKVHTVE